MQANGLRLWVGQPNVFDGHTGDTARQKTWVFAPLEHPREPIQRGIGIRSAHGFMQCADQVVMFFAGFVVFRGAFHQAGGQCVGVEFTVNLPCGHLFDQIKQPAPVAIGHFQQALAGGTIKGEFTI